MLASTMRAKADFRLRSEAYSGAVLVQCGPSVPVHRHATAVVHGDRIPSSLSVAGDSPVLAEYDGSASHPDVRGDEGSARSRSGAQGYQTGKLNVIILNHSRNLIFLLQNNFMMGATEATKRCVYILDFGLSRFFRQPTGEVIPPRERPGFVGSTRYASPNAHDQRVRYIFSWYWIALT